MVALGGLLALLASYPTAPRLPPLAGLAASHTTTPHAISGVQQNESAWEPFNPDQPPDTLVTPLFYGGGQACCLAPVYGTTSGVPSEIYVGYYGGGIWKLSDPVIDTTGVPTTGWDWTPLTENVANGISSLVVSPQNPNDVYALAAEGYTYDMPIGIYPPKWGLLWSDDGGTTWNWTRTIDGMYVQVLPNMLAVSPTDPNTIYLDLASSTTGGIYAATRTGDTWQATLVMPDSDTVWTCGNQSNTGPSGGIVIDPADPNVLFIGAGQAIVKATDEDGTWSDAVLGSGFLVSLCPYIVGNPQASIPAGVGSVIAIAISPSDPAIMYAAFAGNSPHVVYSTDGGATWHAWANEWTGDQNGPLTLLLEGAPGNDSGQLIMVSPTDPSVLTVADYGTVTLDNADTEYPANGGGYGPGHQVHDMFIDKAGNWWMAMNGIYLEDAGGICESLLGCAVPQPANWSGTPGGFGVPDGSWFMTSAEALGSSLYSTVFTSNYGWGPALGSDFAGGDIYGGPLANASASTLFASAPVVQIYRVASATEVGQGSKDVAIAWPCFTQADGQDGEGECQPTSTHNAALTGPISSPTFLMGYGPYLYQIPDVTSLLSSTYEKEDTEVPGSAAGWQENTAFQDLVDQLSPGGGTHPFPLAYAPWWVTANWTNPDVVYVTDGQLILYTTDGGKTWQNASPAIPYTQYDQATGTVLQSPVGHFRELWQSYTTASNGLPGTLLTTCTTTPGTAGPCIFESEDGGASWQDITGNLPAASQDITTCKDEASGAIYVGGLGGVWVTDAPNGAATDWVRAGTGMPGSAIVTQLLCFTNGNVFAETNGYGYWMLNGQTAPWGEPPSVSQVSATSGANGTVVTVSGTGFTPTHQASFPMTGIGPAEPETLYLTNPNSTWSGNAATALQTTATATSVTATIPTSDLAPGQTATLILATPGVDLTFAVTAPSAPSLPYGFYQALPAPYRVLDTRCNAPSAPSYCASEALPDQNAAITTLSPGKPVEVQVAGLGPVPSDATAVALNVTGIDGSSPGYLSLGASLSGATSVLNLTPGEIVPNLVLSGVSSTGTIEAEPSAPMDLVIDVEGYFSSAGTGAFVPLATPDRVLDTRCNVTSPPAFCANEALLTENASTIDVPAHGSVSVSLAAPGVPTDALGADVVLTVPHANANGWMVAYAPGATMPLSSNLNFTTNATVANSAIVSLAGDSFVVANESDAPEPLVVDLFGIFEPTSPGSDAGAFSALPAPVRICDTRSASSIGGSDVTAPGVYGLCANGGGYVMPGMPLGISGISNALGSDGPGLAAVALNLTTVDASEPGWVSLTPGGTSSLVSNANPTPGAPHADAAIVGLDNNAFVANTGAPVGLVVDVEGVFW